MSTSSERLKGTVTQWRKVFGFIHPDGWPFGKNLFVFHEQIQMEGYKFLRRDERVEFEVGPGKGQYCGRFEAKNVVRLDKLDKPRPHRELPDANADSLDEDTDVAKLFGGIGDEEEDDDLAGLPEDGGDGLDGAVWPTDGEDGG